LPQELAQKPPLQNSISTEIEAKLQQAVALHQQGRLADAERLYEEILRQQPNNSDALHLLGVIALQSHRTEHAVELITRAIEFVPNAAGAHSNLGIALNKLKRFEEALASYDKAITLNQGYAEAYNNRGVALKGLKRHGEALASYDRAIALKPDYVEAHYNRAHTLNALRRHEQALASCEMAIAFKPDAAEAYDIRGSALYGLNLHKDAIESFEKATTLKPDYAEAYSNHGLALAALNKHEEALASYDKAISLKPDFPEAHNNRANELTILQRPEQALAGYDKAIALKPDLVDAYANKSLLFLLQARFEEGWRLYEWRKKKTYPIAPRLYSQPLWSGDENIAGKTILLYGEQGLGDAIHFCRYTKLVSDLGARVVLEVPKSLARLFKSLGGVAELVEAGCPLPYFDYHCSLMSLPLAFRTNLSNIPATIPYLKSDSDQALFWKERLAKTRKLRVGLVWAGGLLPHMPETWNIKMRRNIPLAKLASLKHPDIEFYSLQKGQPGESELPELVRNKWDGPDIIDFTSRLNDFADTAALVENLDLVISVDTSTAHLAGAMGKPVWILNCYETCWRWLLDRSDSPWYPTVKLYRQEKPGAWDDVVRRVKIDLISAAGA
jgi:tetratricopeptide (TPR) repeat protein